MTLPVPGVQVQREAGLDGLADMVADLLDGNLDGDPERARLLSGKTWRVGVHVPEAESRFRLEIGEGRLAMSGLNGGSCDLAITADGDTLIELPSLPLVVGLPDPRRAVARAVIAKILRRQLRIRGLLRHPVLLTRVLRLLHTDSDT